jgi:hypothetical protein
LGRWEDFAEMMFIPLTAFIIMLGLLLMQFIAFKEEKRNAIIKSADEYGHNVKALALMMDDYRKELDDYKKRVDALTLRAGFKI